MVGAILYIFLIQLDKNGFTVFQVMVFPRFTEFLYQVSVKIFSFPCYFLKESFEEGLFTLIEDLVWSLSDSIESLLHTYIFLIFLIFIYMYICIFIDVFRYEYVYVYVDTCVCVFVCDFICGYIDIHMYIYVLF